MDVSEQIKVFQDFIEVSSKAELLEQVRKGVEFLLVDFASLARYSPDLADEILEQPEETLSACEIAITNFDLPKKITKFKIRLFNLPDEEKTLIRNIRSKHIGKMLVMEGIVRQKSDVRPQVTSAKFECPSCGNVIAVLQLDTKFKEPTRCGCGRKGKFRLLNKELIDAQGIVLEESSKDLEGGEQPKRMNILLKNDLVSPMSEKRTNPGTSIRLTGILKEIPIILRSGGQSTKFDLMIESNNVEALEEDYSNIEISEEEVNEIKELSKDPKIFHKLSQSLAPGIYGHDKIKEALILQFMGGVRKKRDDGVMTRGDIHMLLIGDPGAGKTVSGDTNIQLSDGTSIKIREFVEKHFSGVREYCAFDKSVYVPSLNPNGVVEHKRITGLWKRKKGELYKIKTRTGKEIICTNTNPFFALKHSKIHITQTKDLIVGDSVALPRKISLLPLNEQTFFMLGKKETLTPKIGRLFAYLLAESYCCYDLKKQVYRVEFVNKDKQLIHDFKEICISLFGHAKHYDKHKSCSRIILHQKNIVKCLYEINPFFFENSFHKKIPNLLLRSPHNVVISFLRTFFECDGYLENGHGVGITLASKEMVEQIQTLLLRFGIMSQLRKTIKYATNTRGKIRRTYWKLNIYGQNAKQFQKEIGFVSHQKNLALSKINAVCSNTNVDLIPGLGTVLKYVRGKLRMTQFSMNVPRTTYQHYERGGRQISHTSLQKVVQALKVRLCELMFVYTKTEEVSLFSNREIYHASQQEFSQLLGCSQTLVSQYEQGIIKKDKQFDYSSLKKEIKDILSDEKLLRYLNDLALLCETDVLWDYVENIEQHEISEPYIYDLEIEDNHSFIANNMFIHNSQLLKRAAVVAPKARFVSGKGASGAGLTATVVRDEFLSGWSLEAGALVLANRGILMIDELDKMTPEDRSAMHEGLEQQTISISKANIQATLRCETTVLAAANPKFGRFDPYETIAKQIDLPPALINRFDLIFTIKDIPDKEKDERLAHFILSLHKKQGTQTPPLDTELLRKYLVYGRQRVFPVLTQEALEELKSYYVKMRSSGTTEDKVVSSIPLSPRQLEALVRLSEAAAKVRLSELVEKKDAMRAISLLHYCLEQVGLDPETGKIDIDMISTGISSSERSKLIGVREIINGLEGSIGKIIPVEEIIKVAQEKGINEDKVMETIEKLKRSGDLFEPKRGHISKI